MGAVPPRTRSLIVSALAISIALGVSFGTTVAAPPQSGASVASVGSVPGVATTAPPVAPAPQPVQWRDCPQEASMQCGSLSVPLDYMKPNGQKISIALLRVPARRASKRVGSLLVNPGGPGASGVDFAARARRLFGSRITERFDIVGFDPRGTLRSSQADCLTDARMDTYLAADPVPDSPKELAQLVAVSKEIADGCKTKVGVERLRNLGTFDAARDMEQIRRALGEQQISMFGFSYGTLLGATYAELYPGRVRAFALDGALDAQATSADRSREQARGFESVLAAWAAQCRTRKTCPRALRASPLGAVDRVLAAVERQPLQVGARSVGPGEAMLGLVRALYSRTNGWPRLDAALVDALAGNGAKLLVLSDDYSNRDARGRYDGVLESNTAINCIDSGGARDVESITKLADELSTVSARFGAAIAYGSLPCAFWPVSSLSDGWTTRAAGSAPILVIGTTNDPATPYVWAKSMAEQLDNGVLLTNVGDNHTAYFSGGSCVRDAIEDYLVDLKVPAPNTTCG